jgi:hypothetical protein
VPTDAAGFREEADGVLLTVYVPAVAGLENQDLQCFVFNPI